MKDKYEVYLPLAKDLSTHIKENYSFSKKSQEFNEAILKIIKLKTI